MSAPNSAPKSTLKYLLRKGRLYIFHKWGEGIHFVTAVWSPEIMNRPTALGYRTGNRPAYDDALKRRLWRQVHFGIDEDFGDRVFGSR